MSAIKILIVEDDPQDLQTCRDTVARYRSQRSRDVELVESTDVQEAFDKMDSTFDGVIIDITLKGQPDAGNDVIKRIAEEFLRVPVAVLTATPDHVAANFPYIGVFKKGDQDAGYDNLLDRFWTIYDTGLTRILGGRGTIETELTKVFRRSILPHIAGWERHGQKDSNGTEKALLRHILNHLMQLVDEDVDHWLPEEFYLCPPPGEHVRTGTILNEKGTEDRFVVMTPDCDLVLRSDGSRNTDRIIVVQVIAPKDLPYGLGQGNPSALRGEKKRNLTRAMENKGRQYYHCLPLTDAFPLSFLDFRRVVTVPWHDVDQRFHTPPEVQISPPFVKDIVARFSSYYARQGQPDIDFNGFFSS